MTKIDIFSGFLGAGKTTLIKKLIKESYTGEKLVLIENEFGEIGVDGGFLQDAGINITEMNSGCICCSLVGDFAKALKQVKEKYNPDRILIEPSGVGKLSDVIKAVEKAELTDCTLNSFTAVVDVNKCKMYLRNFGEFFEDQVKNANCIVLSHTGKADEDKVETIVHLLRLHNENAVIVTTDWEKLDGKALVEAMEKTDTLEEELKKLHEEHEHDDDDDEECSCGCGHHHHHDDDDEEEHEHHHHHDDDDDEECSCGCGHHHHHDDDDEEEHEHHHHHDDDEHEHHHEHHYDENGVCSCGHHHHEHGHHHHADEIFTSWGRETAKKYSVEEIENILKQLENEDEYGTVLRAKGIVAGEGAFVHFDYVPEEIDVREGSAAVTGRICVIGCKLKEENLEKLFKI